MGWLCPIRCWLRSKDVSLYVRSGHHGTGRGRGALHLYFPEEEAAYLTLHFQASVERLHQNESHPQKVIIVCHMGVGMSQLLLAKVERRFPSVHVEATMSRAEVQDYLVRS